MADMAIIRHRPNFAAAPYELVDDETISPQAKAVYLVLDRHADYKTGTTFVGKERVARKCGYSKPDSIDRYLKELKDAGWISWKRRWRRSTGEVDASGRPIYEYSYSAGEGFEPTTSLYDVYDRVHDPRNEDAPIPSAAGTPTPSTAGTGTPPVAGTPIPPTAGTNENQLNENQLNENQGGASAPVADAPTPQNSRHTKTKSTGTPDQWSTAADPRCHNHRDTPHGKVPPCRACATAREWFIDQERNAKQEAAHKRDTCTTCHGETILTIEDTNGTPYGWKCPHDGTTPPTTPNKKEEDAGEWADVRGVLRARA